MQNKVAAKRTFGAAGKKNQIKGKKNPSESPQNDKKQGMKRKGPKENGDAQGKKKKLAFTGTANLDVKKEVAGENGEKVMNRSQRKRLRNKQKREISRHSFGKVINEIQKGDADSIQAIKSKIEAIKARDTITNNARRKLRKLEGILKLSGVPVEGTTEKKVTKKNQKPKNQQQKPRNKNSFLAIVAKEESDENDAEEADDSDVEDSAANNSKEFLSLEGDESGDEEDSDEEVDEEDDDDEEDAEGEEDDAEDDESDEEDDGDEEAKPTPSKQSKPKKNQQNDSQPKGKSRYVVFVGNLPYDIEKQQLMDHFKKVGEIQDIRIVTDPQTKKAKGFAYVEVKNEDSYQKALGLHNTFIGGRKINVQYTQGGKKKGEEAKKEIKAKNMKLQAMRKDGKFGQNQSQKRSKKFHIFYNSLLWL